VSASYWVHIRSCVVVGDMSAVHFNFFKEQIVTKNSSEAELVGPTKASLSAIFFL
jgi:hypothetical protein